MLVLLVTVEIEASSKRNRRQKGCWDSWPRTRKRASSVTPTENMDALSSAVAMKTNCDPQLILMASGLYRLLAVRVGNGYKVAKSRHLFRDFIDASAGVKITDEEVVVRFQKRAHNPLLIAAGCDKTDIAVPWLRAKRLRLIFG